MQGKLCDNGIFFIAEKSGNPVFVHASVQNGSQNDTFLETAIL